MLAESEEHLQAMLNILENYCKQNKLEINTDKTKTMVFNKTGRLMRRPFQINGTQLESVRSYKYLGFLLTPSGEINSGLNDLKDRALRAYMKLKNDLGTSFDRDMNTTLHLIDTMIKPILLYNSDFWGCMKLPKNNPIEIMHMKMCKQLLGVHKNTTNNGVLLETGRVPLGIHAIKAAIKNWERIRKYQANSLLIDSYQNADEENLLWIERIKYTLESNGMLAFYLNPYEELPIFINRKLNQKLYDQFHQSAFESIGKDDSKLRTYAIFKIEKGQEKYLSEIKNTSVRKQLSKFRLSNHSLMIETGRHRNINSERRYCPFCKNLVETEIHFLFHCPIYFAIRNNLIKEVLESKPDFLNLNDNDKLKYLMGDIDTNFGSFVYNAFELRTFLVNNPKRLL